MNASRITAALAAALALATATTHAATIPVSGGGTALQTAIDTAAEGDILLVSPGTYFPIFSTNRAIRIESTGGASATFINGRNANRCATLGMEENQTNTVLVGFTLLNGLALQGGGVYGGTLHNCTLTDNTAPGTSAAGGGAYRSVLNNCRLTGNTSAVNGGGADSCILNSCILTGNTASSGGGGAYGSTLNNCTLTGNVAREGGGSNRGVLNGCTLEDNTASAAGGGAYGDTLNNCTLVRNAAETGGGVYSGLLNGCMLMSNKVFSATGDAAGGGAYSGTLNDCTLVDNTASTSDKGNALGGGACKATLNTCTLSNNMAFATGTGLAFGGGAYEGTLRSSLITENTAVASGFGNASGGGGVGGRAILFNCTVVKNTASSANGAAYGGGVNGWDSSNVCALHNSIVWDNFVRVSGFTQDNNWSTLVTVNYSCTTPLPASSTHSTTNDPLFVNAETGNYRLQSGSPCINAAQNSYVATGAVDLDGNPRIHNGTVDMGAYEYLVFCTVTFNAQGGSVSPTSKVVASGSAYGDLPTPLHATLIFTGWFTATNGGTHVTSATTVVPETNHTLYARWMTLGEALDCASLAWTTGGNAPWFAQTATTYNGSLALQSGAIGDTQNSWVQAIATEPGTLTFWWRVSSEPLYDWLYCVVNGTLNDQISGTAGSWTQKSITFSAGTNTIRWVYSKDFSISSGFDCAWLAGVTWTPLVLPTAPPDTPTGVTASQGTYTDRIAVSWAPSTNAASYTVYRHTSDDSARATPIGTSVAPVYNDTTALVDTAYYYWVQASNMVGDSGLSASAQGLRGSTPLPPPSSDAYLSDPYETAAAAPRITTAYDGFLYDTNNTVRGTLKLNMKATLKKNSKTGLVSTNWSFSAKAILQNKSVSFSGKLPGGPASIEVSKETKATEAWLGVAVRDGRVFGQIGGWDKGGGWLFEVDGARSAFADKSDWTAQSELTPLLGLYNGVLEGNYVPGYLSLSVGAAGVVKIAGNLADGTKVSGSAKLLKGLNEDGWYAIPLHTPLYSKKGFISGLLWLNPKDKQIRVDWNHGWYVDWVCQDPKKGLRADKLDVFGGYFGNGKNVPPAVSAALQAGSLIFIPGEPGDEIYLIPMSPAFGTWMYPWEAITIRVTQNGQKLELPKATQPVKGATAYDYSGANPFGATLSYTAKTGVFKGTYKLYYDGYDSRGNLQHKSFNVSYTGVIVPDGEGDFFGVGTGTTTVNKKTIGLPVDHQVGSAHFR